MVEISIVTNLQTFVLGMENIMSTCNVVTTKMAF